MTGLMTGAESYIYFEPSPIFRKKRNILIVEDT